MAEIKIEKKKPIWPWIILVLVILAILYFLVFADDEEEVDEIETEQVEETAWEEDPETTTWDEQTETEGWEEGEGVSGYLAYISDAEKMGLDHEYTNNAIIELMNAVQAKADEMNYDISADMQSVRQAAEAIQRDPMSLTHADKIKSAGTKLADILENMQQEEFPDLANEVSEVKTAAQKITPATPTLDQKDQIKKFFDEAGDVLRKMS